MKSAKRLQMYAIGLILLELLICPACSEEILLSLQQSLTLGNHTLLIEDADSYAGKVWLCISDDHEPPQSAVVGVGEEFCCGELILAVERIYAGEEEDLVALQIARQT